jgi:hypothetical protein
MGLGEEVRKYGVKVQPQKKKKKKKKKKKRRTLH